MLYAYVHRLEAQSGGFVALLEARVYEPREGYFFAHCRPCEVPGYRELGLCEKKVAVGHLLQRLAEGGCPAYQLVAQPQAHLALYLALFGQQRGNALRVVARNLQCAELAAQRSQPQVVAVVDIEVGNARVVGVE